MADETLGARLLALKDRSGLSLENIARGAGYSRASSIQRYFSAEYDAKFLPRALADRIKEALVGYGDTPVAPGDVERLTEYGFMYDRKLPRPISPQMFQRAQRNTIECNATYPDEVQNLDIEVFRIADDPIQSFARPAHLIRRPISAFYVSTVAMSPRYNPGEIVVIEDERPAVIGQDVLVSLVVEDTGHYAFLATLVSRAREEIVVSLLSPPATLTIPLSTIDAVSPVLTAADLLTPIFTQDA